MQLTISHYNIAQQEIINVDYIFIVVQYSYVTWHEKTCSINLNINKLPMLDADKIRLVLDT